MLESQCPWCSGNIRTWIIVLSKKKALPLCQLNFFFYSCTSSILWDNATNIRFSSLLKYIPTIWHKPASVMLGVCLMECFQLDNICIARRIFRLMKILRRNTIQPNMNHIYISTNININIYLFMQLNKWLIGSTSNPLTWYLIESMTTSPSLITLVVTAESCIEVICCINFY